MGSGVCARRTNLMYKVFIAKDLYLKRDRCYEGDGSNLFYSSVNDLPSPPVRQPRGCCTMIESNATSAGVIPLMRAACANVSGRTAHNFWRLSARSPVTRP